MQWAWVGRGTVLGGLFVGCGCFEACYSVSVASRRFAAQNTCQPSCFSLWRKAMKLVEAAGIENVGYQHDKQQVII